MWVLMAFRKDADQLIEEIPLADLSLDVVRGLWPDNSDDALRGLAFPVDARRSPTIERFAGWPVNLDLADYFVEWIADK